LRVAFAAALFFALTVPQTAPVDPARLPARDSHQGILVACEPYQNPDLVKKAIGKQNPLKAGVLPLEMYVRNSTRWPVAIALDKIRLEVNIPGNGRDQIDPLGPGDLATMILHPKPPNVEVPRQRLPLPLPRSNESRKWQELRDRLESVSFPDAVIAPGDTVHGFLFFDLAGHFDVLPHAELYVPDLKFLGNTQSIMFFQADLGGDFH
jgi:hypothetical protein